MCRYFTVFLAERTSTTGSARCWSCTDALHRWLRALDRIHASSACLTQMNWTSLWECLRPIGCSPLPRKRRIYKRSSCAQGQCVSWGEIVTVAGWCKKSKLCQSLKWEFPDAGDSALGECKESNLDIQDVRFDAVFFCRPRTKWMISRRDFDPGWRSVAMTIKT